jgi:hypothetical protein
VECARLFHKRMQRVMRDFVYINNGTEKGVFGRVKDYVIRYEVQDRGCDCPLCLMPVYMPVCASWCY